MTTKLPHISDEHHFAIANVAARSAQMDVQIERTIAVALAKQPKTAEFLLKNLGADRVVGALKALLLDAQPEQEEPINRLIEKINDLRTERNETLHWTWIRGYEAGTAIAATNRPFREFRHAARSAEQVQNIADEMRTVVQALLIWQETLRQPPEKPSP